MEAYKSQMTFLYFDDLEEGKHFLSEVLQLRAAYTPDWAVVYQAANTAYIGAVDAKRGSVKSHTRGGFLVSLTVDDVLPHYNCLLNHPKITHMTEIKVFEDIGVKSFFFKGPEGYDFEIQQFTGPEYDFTAPKFVKETNSVESLFAAEKAFCEASALNGAAGWASYFLEDGKMLTKIGSPIEGKPAIRMAMEAIFGLERLEFTWQPSYGEVSKDGSLGYTYGTYDRRFLDVEGNQQQEQGMYMSVWKRDEDGQWRVAVDVGN